MKKIFLISFIFLFKLNLFGQLSILDYSNVPTLTSIDDITLIKIIINDIENKII